ncbi:hypothetical protein BH23ACT11_BH23ACT11_24430 [soil metagenome]
MIGESIFAYVHPEDTNHMQDMFYEEKNNPNGSRGAEFRFRHKDGTWRHLDAVCNNLLDEPSVNGLVLNCRDVTERKKLEQQLMHQALHDPLTGLPNRLLFMDRLKHALARLTRSESSVAVLFVDLDNFKLINDSLGHELGDRLLVEVAGRFQEALRSADTVARLGGDEFTILLDPIAGLGEAARVVERITESLQEPFQVEGHEVFVTASIGVALGSKGGEGPQELLRNADMAMYRAKGSGRGRFEVFESSMTAGLQARLTLENDLRRAIERDEFVLYYQPQLEFENGQIRGMEALLRWERPAQGLVSPAEFIPLAEETGMIVPIGSWVLREACRQALEWRGTFGDDLPLVTSVNLSTRQIRWGDIAEEVTQVLHEIGLDPSCLELEITESVVIEDTTNAIETLDRLKELGLRLAIDDFGTGYSSLSYLRRLPVDTLKMDRSFVGKLDARTEEAAIVQAVITLANTMHLEVVGEGVENAGQMRRLRDMGCELGQGYYFSRPLPANEATELLARSRGSEYAPLLAHKPSEEGENH